LDLYHSSQTTVSGGAYIPKDGDGGETPRESKMKRIVGQTLVALALAAGTGFAQEITDETVTVVRRPHIQVLQDPHDIASFYRQGAGGQVSEALASQYPIASYYHSRQGQGASVANPYGYSRFWTSEGSRARNFGRNGELFLFAPFLAPMGPLAGGLLR
jgi:hypothetical protein